MGGRDGDLFTNRDLEKLKRIKTEAGKLAKKLKRRKEWKLPNGSVVILNGEVQVCDSGDNEVFLLTQGELGEWLDPMTTIRLRLASDPITQEITSTGTTLAAAVSRGARKLLGAGRSLGGIRVDSHTHLWDWVVGEESHELVVRESRSGESGRASRPKVLLTLPEDALQALDDYADAKHAGNRSAAVAALALATR